MQLTVHADYALRVLLYLGSHPDRVISTQEISKAYGISKHHLVRVVQRLNAELATIFRSAAMKERLAQLGLDARASSAGEFKTFIANEMQFWDRIVRESNISAGE